MNAAEPFQASASHRQSSPLSRPASAASDRDADDIEASKGQQRAINTMIALDHSSLDQAPILSLSPEEDSEFKRLVYSPSDADEETTSCELAIRSNNDTDVAGPRRGSADPHRRPEAVVAANSIGKKQPKVELNEQQQPQQQLKQQKQLVADADNEQTIELRFLVRRREAGALIGKRGSNIKRLRETFRSSMFSIPDTGNGPERVVCIATDEKSMDAILNDLAQLLMEKSPENDEQIELKLLIHSSHAGSIIGIGGQSIKKLRNESKAAIKIHEMCCPLSNERVCAIKAKPLVVVSTIKLIQSILNDNPIKGTIKPYDALHFDLNLVDKYGGYLPDDAVELMVSHGHYDPFISRQLHDPNYATTVAAPHYPIWRPPDYLDGFGDVHIHHDESRSDSSSSCQHRAVDHGNSVSGGSSSSSSSSNTKQQPIKANNESQPKKADCDVGLEVAANYHQSRAARFHPYAPNMSVGSRQQQLAAELSGVYPNARSTGYARHPAHYGHSMSVQHQVRLAAATAASSVQRHYPAANRMISLSHGNLPIGRNFTQQRCHHASRPCLCMFLPILPDVLATTSTTTAPYYNGAQMARNYSSCSSGSYLQQGYSKRK